MKKYLLICFLLTFGCCDKNFCMIQDEDITNMYSSYVEEWKNKAIQSFDKAESEILSKPDPKPVVVGPDPDVKKCICRGTGVIVQGDDHKTPCPFHSQSQLKPNIIRK